MYGAQWITQVCLSYAFTMAEKAPFLFSSPVCKLATAPASSEYGLVEHCISDRGETVWRARSGQVLITPVTMEPADKKDSKKPHKRYPHSAAADSAVTVWL